MAGIEILEEFLYSAQPGAGIIVFYIVALLVFFGAFFYCVSKKLYFFSIVSLVGVILCFALSSVAVDSQMNPNIKTRYLIHVDEKCSYQGFVNTYDIIEKIGDNSFIVELKETKE